MTKRFIFKTFLYAAAIVVGTNQILFESPRETYAAGSEAKSPSLVRTVINACRNAMFSLYPGTMERSRPLMEHVSDSEFVDLALKAIKWDPISRPLWAKASSHYPKTLNIFAPSQAMTQNWSEFVDTLTARLMKIYPERVGRAPTYDRFPLVIEIWRNIPHRRLVGIYRVWDVPGVREDVDEGERVPAGVSIHQLFSMTENGDWKITRESAIPYDIWIR